MSEGDVPRGAIDLRRILTDRSTTLMVCGYSDLPPSSRQHFAKCKTLEWVPGPGLLRPNHLVCDRQQHFASVLMLKAPFST